MKSTNFKNFPSFTDIPKIIPGEQNSGKIKQNDVIEFLGHNLGEIISEYKSVTIAGDSKFAKANKKILIGGNSEFAQSDYDSITILGNSKKTKSNKDINIQGNSEEAKSDYGSINVGGNSSYAICNKDILVLGNADNSESEYGSVFIGLDSKISKGEKIYIGGNSTITKGEKFVSIGGDSIEKCICDYGEIEIGGSNIGTLIARKKFSIIGNNNEAVSDCESGLIKGDSNIARAHNDLTIFGNSTNKAKSDYGSVTVGGNAYGEIKAHKNVSISGEVGKNCLVVSDYENVEANTNYGQVKAHKNIHCAMNHGNLESSYGSITLKSNSGTCKAYKNIQVYSNTGILLSDTEIEIKDENILITQEIDGLHISIAGGSITVSGNSAISNVSINNGKVSVSTGGLIGKILSIFSFGNKNTIIVDGKGINSSDIKNNKHIIHIHHNYEHIELDIIKREIRVEGVIKNSEIDIDNPKFFYEVGNQKVSLKGGKIRVAFNTSVEK